MSSLDELPMDAQARLNWRKSSHSGGDNGDCVEVAVGPNFVAVRDSKNPAGGALVTSPAGWMQLLGVVRDGALAVNQV